MKCATCGSEICEDCFGCQECDGPCLCTDGDPTWAYGEATP